MFCLTFASLSNSIVVKIHIHTSVSFTRACSNKVKLWWEIFHSCYEPFLSDSDIERILKIDQHLPKLH